MAKQPKSFLPSKAGQKVLPWLWANDAWQEAYPALYELLSAGIVEGEERKPATLTVFVSEGRLKACLRDRHTRQSLWLTLEGDINVLVEVEKAIVDHSGEWRADKRGETLEGVL